MRTLLILCILLFCTARAMAQDVAGARDDSLTVQTPQQLKESMATAGRTDVPGLKGWEREKSAKVAVLSSMVLPGLGQAYNGRKWKAAIAFGLFTFYVSNAAIQSKKSEDFLRARDSVPEGSPPWNAADQFYHFHKDSAIDNLWWAGAVWFISMLDAFVDAHLYDVRAVDPDVFETTGGQKYVGLSVDL